MLKQQGLGTSSHQQPPVTTAVLVSTLAVPFLSITASQQSFRMPSIHIFLSPRVSTQSLHAKLSGLTCIGTGPAASFASKHLRD